MIRFPILTNSYKGRQPKACMLRLDSISSNSTIGFPNQQRLHYGLWTKDYISMKELKNFSVTSPSPRYNLVISVKIPSFNVKKTIEFYSLCSGQQGVYFLAHRLRRDLQRKYFTILPPENLFFPLNLSSIYCASLLVYC